MKIALFTPLNPVRSGIADYNEEMLPELRKHAEIDLYIDGGYTPSNSLLREHFPIHVFRAADFRPQDYDAIVYHMGNNFDAHRYIYEAMKAFPGIVVLHDYVLQGFYAEMLKANRDSSRYLELLQKYYPRDGARLAQRMIDRLPHPIWESELAMQFPLNEEIIGMAKALIVHSEFLKMRVNENHSLPLTVIPHHGHTIVPCDRNHIRRELGFHDHDLVLLSTGFVTKNKRYEAIIPALNELATDNLKYVIIGQDEANYLKVLSKNKALEIIRKGFVSHADLAKYIAAADICLNLRYPTMGENSGSLLRMMSHAKPVLVSDTGSYRDLPDAAVIKISCAVDEKEMITRFVQALAADPDFRHSLGREAARYALEECNMAGCARQYAEFAARNPAPNRSR
ncbi:MAG: glycosyltransferase family 4 protein [Candidatus Aminicenantes bacterium]|nr:glycosyltransferase family 4 protein [Candidatus Aminicenantes bacterium]